MDRGNRRRRRGVALTTMRIAISTLAVALVALTGLTAGAARPPPTVRCSAVILRPQTLDGTHRVVLRNVAFWRRRAFQIAAVGGSLPFWSRTLLFIRSSRTSVTIGVPRAWRTRAALAWGVAASSPRCGLQAARFRPSCRPTDGTATSEVSTCANRRVYRCGSPSARAAQRSTWGSAELASSQGLSTARRGPARKPASTSSGMISVSVTGRPSKRSTARRFAPPART